jgi:tetratricopeptide (TPR) repeat protein
MGRVKKQRRVIKRRTRAVRTSGIQKVTRDVGNESLIESAELLLSKGDNEKAEQAVALLLTADTAENDSAAFLRASRISAFAAAHRKDFERAKTIALKALAVDSELLDFYYVLVYVFTRMEDYTLVNLYGHKYMDIHSRILPAESSRQPFAGTYDKSHEIANNMGVGLREQGNLQDAVEQFESAIRLKPDYTAGYINLARLAQHTGQLTEARDILDRGIRMGAGAQELKMLREAMADTRPRVSLCMIVKDEEENLSRALKSVKDVVDEMIVVDTGSTDRTIDIAKGFGAKVYHHKWEKNFSKARNESISYATGEWIFILDADEELLRDDVPFLKDILARAEENAISVSVFNVAENDAHASFLPSIRFFRRTLGAYYDGIVHNQLKFDEEHNVILRAGVRINHYGYALSPEKMKAKIERSKELLLKQLEENPNDPFANMNIAQIYRGESAQPSPDLCGRIIYHAQKVIENTGLTQEAKVHLRLMALHQMASAYFFMEEFGRVRDLCMEAIGIKPDYLDPIITLGYVATRKAEWEEAKKWYQRYLEAKRNFKDYEETDSIILLNYQSERNAHYGLGQACENLDQTVEAIRWYESAVEDGERYLDTFLRLSELFYNQDEYSKAIDYAEKHLSAEPSAWPAHYIAGESYRLSGNYDSAIMHLQEAASICEGSQETIYALARALFEAGRLDEADRCADVLIAKFPDFEHAFRVVADIKYATSRFDLAARYYEKWTMTCPNDEEVWNNLGNSYFKLGRFEEAEQRYRRALSLSPDMAVAARNLGISLAKIDRTSEAASVLSSFLELSPDDFQVAHLLGDLMRQMGKLGSAVKMYELCVSLDPRAYSVITKLADIYSELGSTDSARLGYYQALKIKPDYEPARTRLSELDAMVTKT